MGNLDKVVFDACKGSEKDFIKDWGYIVNIDSPTCYSKGLKKIADFTIQKLDAMAAEFKTYPVDNEDEGFNVEGTLKGNGKHSILLLAHMDTVFPADTAKQRPFRIDNEGKAYGPGVSDDKCGIIQCLYAMKILKDMGYGSYKKITLLVNCQEENGSHYSRKCIMKLAQEHDYVLCVEAGTPADGVCINRVGSGNLVTEIKGVMAHAAYPRQGCNAANELAFQVLQIIQLANEDKGTIITTRFMESGIMNLEKNVVPDQAKAIQRVYAYTPEEIKRVEISAHEISKKPSISGAEVKSTFNLAFPPFVKSKKTIELASLAQTIYSEIGRSLSFSSGAAATDAGWASIVNDATLCSLGPVSGGCNHSDKEWADAKSVVPRLYLLTRMLMHLGFHGL
jgi:glutamate carboxypeptidase